ncbi:MAG: hypothetical protein QW350_00665 [Candidatus Aenigmatarchaeota archaeon]
MLLYKYTDFWSIFEVSKEMDQDIQVLQGWWKGCVLKSSMVIRK